VEEAWSTINNARCKLNGNAHLGVRWSVCAAILNCGLPYLILSFTKRTHQSPWLLYTKVHMLLAVQKFCKCKFLCALHRSTNFLMYIMFFSIMGSYSGMNFATKDRYCLNLLIYCNVKHNLTFYYGYNFRYF